MTGPQQLALTLAYAKRYTAKDFLAAPSNQVALDWLQRTAQWPDGRLLLWGDNGCGKTHLLHIWASAHGAAILTGDAVLGLPPAPAGAGIAIDNIDTAQDETALLHLLNAYAEARLPVLLSATTPPSRWQIDLPDLASRLRAITAVAIGPPEDQLLQALLIRLVNERQLIVPASVQSWLLLRLPRTPEILATAVARLDTASLEAGRHVTISLARTALADLLCLPLDEICASPPPAP